MLYENLMITFQRSQSCFISTSDMALGLPAIFEFPGVVINPQVKHAESFHHII